MTINLTVISFWGLVFLLVYPYTVYPLLLRTILLFRRKNAPAQKNMEPTVSILIAAYNEESVIAERIQNLLQLRYPREKLEIIIASDGSSDETVAIAQSFEPQGVRVLDYKERQGKVNVLNASVPQAAGEIVVFSDANTQFKTDAVHFLVQQFAAPGIACVCGKLIFKPAADSGTGEMESGYWRLENVMKQMEGMLGALPGANGAIFALRKSLWQPCPSDTLVEDLLIPIKLLLKGHKVAYEPRALAYEDTAAGIGDEFARRVRIGAGDYQALTRLWPLINPVHGWAALTFVSRKVLRWLTPAIMLALLSLNLMLLSSPVYQAIFALQLTGYGLAVCWAVWPRLFRGPLRLFSTFGYFISMNAALFCGFVRFVSGRQSVKWRRTPRASEV